MKKWNPVINELNLKTLKAGNEPLKIRDVSTTGEETLISNIFWSGKTEEGVTLTFKLNDWSDLSNQNIKMKGSDTFAVTWWIEWFEYV